jgi:hypothetical protein
MNRFADETLPADRMSLIVDALVGEAAGGAFKRFMAVGKADHNQRSIKRFLKFLNG